MSEGKAIYTPCQVTAVNTSSAQNEGYLGLIPVVVTKITTGSPKNVRKSTKARLVKVSFYTVNP